VSIDSSGLLWGTTNAGGTNQSGGVVFNLKRDGSQYRVVVSFYNAQPGLSTLSFGKTGHVFGNTASYDCSGGTYGSVFMLSPSGKHD
jgi:hypothetical protein